MMSVRLHLTQSFFRKKNNISVGRYTILQQVL